MAIQPLSNVNSAKAIQPVANIIPRPIGQEKSGDVGSVAEKGLRSKLIQADERLSTLEEVFDEKTLKRMGVVECATCASRTYQDQSDDSSVSFQSPTHLSPEQAASAVIGHEMEHVSNEQADARAEGKEVVSQSVAINHSICPECGKSYVSGGLTRTTTMEAAEYAYGAMKGEVGEGNIMDYDV